MEAEELIFFDRAPGLMDLYAQLRALLCARYAQISFQTRKTQISIRNRRLFAMVSLPARRVPGRTGDFFMLSFGLARRASSPRIFASVEAYPNRWTHHVPLGRPEEIDEELLSWLDEAYSFANAK